MGSLDLPDQPDGPRRVERADAGRSDRPTPKPRELPDPDERGRVYEATQARVSAETSHEAPPSRRPDGTDRPRYWDEVPRFQKMWADHEENWPARKRAADGSADPPDCAEAILRIRKAEPQVSADAQAIEQENRDKYGGWLEGFKHRLKDEDRLKEKIVEGVSTASPDATPNQVLRLIPDAIRYTFCFQPDNYGRGYYDIKERFENRGYEMYYSENWWTNPEYKGVNTRWVTPEGQRFEVQFHTPESFHAKHHLTHLAFERIRAPAPRRAELRELHAFQREVSSRIQVPDGAVDIPNFRKEGFSGAGQDHLLRGCRR